jgi:hypothetical protein
MAALLTAVEDAMDFTHSAGTERRNNFVTALGESGGQEQ